jgi:nucleotidyltransferase/DNA polymerase involved in DNA repair
VAGDPRHVASNIKQAVRDATGLSCSICVAPNKLLAKIGSELDKPDGLTLLTHADVPVRILPLSVRKVNGIGPKATERLAALGIATVGELAAADPGLLQTHFGWGERPVALVVPRKGVTTTLTEDEVRKHVFAFSEKGQISKYALPQVVKIVEALERTSVGKMNKKRLREQFI